MAENSLRYRTSPAFLRSRPSTENTTAPSAYDGDNHSVNEASTDPLAELARLVGEIDARSEPSPGARRASAINTFEAPLYRAAQPRTEPAFEADPHEAADHAEAPPLADHRYGAAQGHDAYAQQSYATDDQEAHFERYAQPQYGEEARQDAGYESEEPGYAPEEEQVASDQSYDEEQYDQQYEQQYAEQDEYPPYDEAEEDAPRRPRGRLVTVAAVLCLAVVGTAGAYAYRSVFGGGVSATPPIIKADTTPNKIAAAPSDAGNKPIVDRIGDRPQNERVVPREEQPLEVKQPPRPQVQNPVGGWPVPPGSPPAAPAATAPPAAPSPGEPRQVKTVSIAPTAGQSAAQPPAPARAPAADTGSAVSRAPSARPAPPAAEQNAALAPQNDASARAPAPAPAVRKYVVQLAASNTREDAQAALRAAQAKYSDLLSGRHTLVKEKKSADHTVFAAQIGPLSSKEEAVELCQRLKSAGASCFVQ